MLMAAATATCYNLSFIRWKGLIQYSYINIYIYIKKYNQNSLIFHLSTFKLNENYTVGYETISFLMFFVCLKTKYNITDKNIAFDTIFY